MKKHIQLRRWAVATGAGLLACAGLLTAGPAPAQASADVSGYGPMLVITDYRGGWTIHMGSYATSEGLGYCAFPSLESPTGEGLSDPTPTSSLVNDQGDSVSADRLHAIAALLSLHGGSTANDWEAAAVELALRDLVGLTDDVLGPGGDGGHSWQLDDPDSDGSRIAALMGVGDLALEFRNEAVAWANNWDGTGSISIDKTQTKQPGDSFTVTVRLPGIDDSTGHGWHVAFYVTKPDGTIETINETTNNSIATLTYTTAPGVYGSYSVDARLLDDVPPAWPLIAAANSSHQSLLMSGGMTRDWTDPESVSFTATRAAPTITTQVSSQLVLPGQTVSDTVTLGGLIAGSDTTYALIGFLVSVPAPADYVCPAAGNSAWKTASIVSVIPRTSVPASSIKDGAASLKVGEWTVPQTSSALCVSYGENLTMYSPDGNVTVDHPAGDVTQTALVVNLPTITTQISTQLALPGDTISDTVQLSGLVTASGITYSLAGSFVSVPAPVNGVCPASSASAWKTADTVLAIKSASVPASSIKDGAASLKVGEWTVPETSPALCVSYGETVTVHSPEGDVTVDHPAGDVTQTALVVGIPTVTTKVSSQLAQPGDTITDSVRITGLVSNADITYTLSGALWAVEPADIGTCPAPGDKAWQDANHVATIDPVTLTPDMIGKDGTTSLLPTKWTLPKGQATACYSYSETLTVQITGNKTPVIVQHPVGTTPQTSLVVGKPTITTEISTQLAQPGDTITDAVYIEGLVTAPGVTYTLSGGLWAVEPVSPGVCPAPGDDAWQNATQAAVIESITLTKDLIDKDGNAELASGGFTIPFGFPALCYSFSETLTVEVTGGKTPMVVEHQAGKVSQTAFVVSGIVETAEVETGGDVVTGIPGGIWPWLTPGLLIGASLAITQRVRTLRKDKAVTA